MALLLHIENAFRTCNQYHGDEHFDYGLFIPETLPPWYGTGEDLDETDSNDIEEKPQQGGAPTIPVGDMLAMTRKKNLAPEDQEHAEFISKNRIGSKISDNQFDEFCKEVAHPEDSEEFLSRAFHSYDPENTGFVSKAQVKDVLQNYGERMSDDDVDSILKQICPNQERIHYGQFCRKLLGLEDVRTPSLQDPSTTKQPEPKAKAAAPAPPPPSPSSKEAEENDLFFKKLFDANPTRKLSKFVPVFYKAGLAPTSDDMSNVKSKFGDDINNVDKMKLVMEELTKADKGPTGFLEYFEYYDKEINNGKLTYKLPFGTIVNQLEETWMRSDYLTKAEAKEIVTRLVGEEAKNKEVNYRDFCTKLYALPPTVERCPHPELVKWLADFYSMRSGLDSTAAGQQRENFNSPVVGKAPVPEDDGLQDERSPVVQMDSLGGEEISGDQPSLSKAFSVTPRMMSFPSMYEL